MGASKMAIRLINLAGEHFKFKIIEPDIEVCRKLPQKCSHCEIIHGDARDTDLLAEIGIDEYDAFAALTDSSEANILTCLTAKEMGIRKTIANVENIQFISQAENLNIGMVVNKKLLASSTIFQILLDTDSSTSKCLALADAEVAELDVRPGSKVAGIPVKHLKLSRQMTMADSSATTRECSSTATPFSFGRPCARVLPLGALHKVENFSAEQQPPCSRKIDRSLVNLPMIQRIIGWLLCIEAAFLLFPMAACLIYHETDWQAFAITSRESHFWQDFWPQTHRAPNTHTWENATATCSRPPSG